jgi:hypothetical protein
MSSDGTLKLGHLSHISSKGDTAASARKQGQNHERICALCEHPISKRQPPVLLKSGESVHLDCYLQMPKRPHNRGRNSK